MERPCEPRLWVGTLESQSVESAPRYDFAVSSLEHLVEPRTCVTCRSRD